MNEKAKSMPDRFHSLDNTMSLDKIIQAQNTGTPLMGKVVLWNSMEKHLEVHLGNGYYGYIPENLVSIYPNYDINPCNHPVKKKHYGGYLQQNFKFNWKSC